MEQRLVFTSAALLAVRVTLLQDILVMPVNIFLTVVPGVSTHSSSHNHFGKVL